MSRAQWVALSILPGVGGVIMRRLLAHFGSLSAIFEATESELCAVRGIGEKTAHAIRRASPEATQALLDVLSRQGVRALTWNDPDFPPNLGILNDAPPTLFVQGILSPADGVAVAVVGARSATPAGLQAAGRIAGELASRDVTIVSGLAIGVDSAAHRGALSAGGRTLAVLGSGIRTIYPKRNRGLAARITAHGALLSELHPDAVPNSSQLVARDRIISGLSRWVILVESDTTGGSMRTAEFARRQGRVLAAVPGSPGANLLIGAGARSLDWQMADWDEIAMRVRSTQVAVPRKAVP